MAEYIELGAVLEIAMQYCPDDDGSCTKADKDLRDMLDEIEGLEAADVQPVDRWISIKEKLPPEDESVLIYTIMGMCVAARWDDRFFVSKTASFAKYDVTHWMPLPEPPKDGDKE